MTSKDNNDNNDNNDLLDQTLCDIIITAPVLSMAVSSLGKSVEELEVLVKMVHTPGWSEVGQARTLH